MQLAAFSAVSLKWHFGDCGEICGYPTAENKKGADGLTPFSVFVETEFFTARLRRDVRAPALL
jgi:hypothetical protein